jgi:benzoyl-CoA 2,3-epoxidase subunit A
MNTLNQHLIDPEICIRCNTCEAICPQLAITHDDRNYVVDADKCNLCMACISPCPTGSIDNWRTLPRTHAYTPAEQLTWDELPAAWTAAQWAEQGVDAGLEQVADPANTGLTATTSIADKEPPFNTATFGAALPPWSAAHAYVNLYGPKAPITVTVAGNVRVTQTHAEDDGKDYDTHHIVLDFGRMPFPVLEGQSIGILPPGLDAHGKPHHARMYSIASPRNGERVGYNNVSLTIKRVLEDPQGQPVHGVASNFMCDVKVGDSVQVIGPFGTSFLMPNHPRSHIVMICTGTGSAPMRAMTEWRRRLRQSGKFEGGKLMLFFGARTQAELPYFGPLQNLPKDFIDIHFTFSRTPGLPKRYVQDAMRERAADLGALLKDPDTHIYVCGLKSMEEGVLLALRDAAVQASLSWEAVGAALKREGRLHLETY